MTRNIITVLCALTVSAHAQYAALVNNTAQTITFQAAEPFGINYFPYVSPEVTVPPGQTKSVYLSWWPWEATYFINHGYMLTSTWGSMTAGVYYTNYLTTGQPISIKSSDSLSDQSGYAGDLYAYTTLTLGSFKGTPYNTDSCSLTDPQCGGNVCPIGMAGYSFNSFQAALHIQDTPLAYSSPVGPDIAFTLAYNQRDTTSTNFFCSNLGPKWSLSAVSYLEDSPLLPASDVRCILPGGGAEVYTGANTNTGTYQTQLNSHTTLTKQAPGSYVKGYPDGSTAVYNYTNNTTPRRVFLTQDTDSAGNSIHYNYETLSNNTVRLDYVVDTLGQTNTFTYALSDQLKVTAITDPFGHTASFSYANTNGNNRLSSITDPVGIVSQFTYSTNDFINSLTTPYGTTTFATSEDPSARMIQATDPYGQTERLENRCWTTLGGDAYVPSGLLTSTADYGLNNTYFWNKAAFAQYGTNITYADITHWVSKSWTLQPYPLWTKKPLENRIWYNYPGQTDGIGSGITNGSPSVMARVFANGTNQLYKASYNSLGLPISTTDPIGRVTSITYATNQVDVLQVSQKNGTNYDVLTQTSYNSQHLPTVTIVNGVTNYYGYATNGLLSSVTNGLGELTTLSYDPSWRLITITGNDPAATITLTYDGANRPASITDSDGYSVSYNYDNLNRLVQANYPDATVRNYIYSIIDLTDVQDRDQRWVHKSYDSLRHLQAVEDKAGRLFSYDWCACGSPSSITDPKGTSTFWNRDAQNRPTSKSYTTAVNTYTALDTWGYEIGSSRLTSADSTTLNYNIDDTLNQLIFQSPSRTNTYTYDPNYVRPTQLVDIAGTSSFTYVPAGQSGAGSLKTWAGPLPNSTITNTYDVLGRLYAIQIGAQTKTAVTYDYLDRISSASNNLGVVTLSYDGVSDRPITQSLPNGLGSTFSYTAVADGKRLQTITTTNSAGQVVEQYTYQYDVNNRIISQAQQIGGVGITWNYDYDAAGQLLDALQWTNGVFAKRFVYTYDLAGNRISEQINSTAASANPNTLNQTTTRYSGYGQIRVGGYISEPGTVAIRGIQAEMLTPTNFQGSIAVYLGTNSYAVVASDFFGNATTNQYQVVVGSNGLNTTYTCGTMAVNSAANTYQTLSYAYDTGLQMITGITNTTLASTNRTVISYDSFKRWTRIQEYQGTNTIPYQDRRFVWNGTTLAEERDSTGTNIVKRFFADGFQWKGTNFYYLKDHLGSIREVADTNGNIVARFDYDPYGRRTQTFGTLQVDFGFAGLFEHQSGVKFAVWRIYDPNTAKWLSIDPIREDGGWNLYAYCGNDPVNATDESGLAIYPLSYTGPLLPSDQRGFTKEQYNQITALIKFERLHGADKETARIITALRYSNTFGSIYWKTGKGGLSSFNSDSGCNKNIMHPIYGNLDLDWFTDIAAAKVPLVPPSVPYRIGKFIWVESKVLFGLQNGSKPQAYQDPGEGTAVELNKRNTSFGQIFTPEILKQFYQ